MALTRVDTRLKTSLSVATKKVAGPSSRSITLNWRFTLKKTMLISMSTLMCCTATGRTSLSLRTYAWLCATLSVHVANVHHQGWVRWNLWRCPQGRCQISTISLICHLLHPHLGRLLAHSLLAAQSSPRRPLTHLFPLLSKSTAVATFSNWSPSLGCLVPSQISSKNSFKLMFLKVRFI